METVKLKELSKDAIKDTIAKLEERLAIISNTERELKKKNGYDKNEKFECEICGGKYTPRNRAVHFRSQKHKREVQHYDSIRRLARSKTIASRLQLPKDL